MAVPMDRPTPAMKGILKTIFISGLEQLDGIARCDAIQMVSCDSEPLQTACEPDIVEDSE